MKYEKLIQTLSEVVNNDNIYKVGLTLSYKLNEENHRRMSEELFYKSNSLTATFIPSDEFEVEIGGILIKFIVDKPEPSE